MTQDRIIELAREAGMEWQGGFSRVVECSTQPELERFAAIVRAQTLEEAAKKRAKPPRKLPRLGTGALLAGQQHCYELGYREGAAAVRAAIRALKGQP